MNEGEVSATSHSIQVSNNAPQLVDGLESLLNDESS